MFLSNFLINTAQAVSLPNFSQSKDLPGFISSVYSFALTVVGIAVFVRILWGGFRLLTAAGNTSKIGEARDMIKNAVIGAILLFAAYLILFIVNPDLVKNTFNFTIPKAEQTQPTGSTPTNPTPSNAVLIGTPSEAGTWSFTIRVTDANGDSCDKGFNIEISSGEGAQLNKSKLGINIAHAASDCSTVSILTETLPNGVISQPYYAEIQVTGGKAPYTYQALNVGASFWLPIIHTANAEGPRDTTSPCLGGPTGTGCPTCINPFGVCPLGTCLVGQTNSVPPHPICQAPSGGTPEISNPPCGGARGISCPPSPSTNPNLASSNSPLPPGLGLQATDQTPLLSITNGTATRSPKNLFYPGDIMVIRVINAKPNSAVFSKDERSASAEGPFNCIFNTPGCLYQVGVTDSTGVWSKSQTIPPNNQTIGFWRATVQVNHLISNTVDYRIAAAGTAENPPSGSCPAGTVWTGHLDSAGKPICVPRTGATCVQPPVGACPTGQCWTGHMNTLVTPQVPICSSSGGSVSCAQPPTGACPTGQCWTGHMDTSRSPSLPICSRDGSLSSGTTRGTPTGGSSGGGTSGGGDIFGGQVHCSGAPGAQCNDCTGFGTGSGQTNFISEWESCRAQASSDVNTLPACGTCGLQPGTPCRATGRRTDSQTYTVTRCVYRDQSRAIACGAPGSGDYCLPGYSNPGCRESEGEVLGSCQPTCGSGGQPTCSGGGQATCSSNTRDPSGGPATCSGGRLTCPNGGTPECTFPTRSSTPQPSISVPPGCAANYGRSCGGGCYQGGRTDCNGNCVGGTAVGTHLACVGKTCKRVSNEPDNCQSECSSNSDCE